MSAKSPAIHDGEDVSGAKWGREATVCWICREASQTPRVTACEMGEDFLTAAGQR
ncbi:MAG: hypothetical protein NVSMB43_09100 [Pseudarthrobacter sp.]